MKIYPANLIKNIAIIGSPGSGKTTLSESMLYEGGVIKKRGGISQKNTVCDYFPVEREYQYSVFSSLFSIEWKDRKLNFIDCPGSSDFSGNVFSALSIMDTALMLINGQYGVEIATNNLFRYTEQLKKPLIIAVNKLDHEKCDYENTVRQIKESFGSGAVIVQYPINCGPSFNAIVDVLTKKMYRWKPEGGVPEVMEIPGEEEERFMDYHQALVEAAAENDENLMEKFFDEGSLTEENMWEGIRKGLLNRDLFPIFCVCAEKDMCVRRTLEFLGNIVPCTDKLPPYTDTKGEKIAPDPDSGTRLFVFKTTMEPHIGKVSYFRVMSGKIKEGDELLNANREIKERISQLFVVSGQMRYEVPELSAGDIGACVKLKDTHTGDTLNGKGADSRFDFITYPEPKFRRAVKAVDPGDSEKLMELLGRMHAEDPTWIIEQSKELRQTIVYGQGEFHLKTLKWRIENNEKIPLEFSEPKIPYRETITKISRADYRHKKQSGGAGQFGEVHLIVEPYKEGMELPSSYKIKGQEFKIQARDIQNIDLEWGGKLVFVNSIVGGSIDARFLPAILKGILSKMERGPITGSYARDVRVIVYEGKMHPVDSNEVSFMIAGRNAFSEAFRNAGPKLLEPVYELEVITPSEFMGDVMNDLQSRRALITGMNSEKGYERLQAKVPLKELSSYSTALSAVTGGGASFTMKFADYELVPTEIQNKLLKEYEVLQEAEA